MKKAGAGGDLRIEYMALSVLVKWPKNPKEHDLDSLGDAFKRFGYVDPIIIDEKSGRMVAGHGRLERLELSKAAGEKPPERIKVRADGEWLVPVLRGISFKSSKEAAAYLLASNQQAMLRGFDDVLLADFVKSFDVDLDTPGIGFEQAQIDDIRAALDPDDARGGGDSDVTPASNPMSKQGDLWILGDHRLLVGSSTVPADVARLMDGKKAVLMSTDPPYGVDYTATKGLQDTWGDIENDALDPKKLRAFLEDLFVAVAPVLAKRVAGYVWHPSGELNEIFRAAMVAHGWLVHRQIIWAKANFVMTRSGMYHWRHETAFYGWLKGNVPPWYGDKTQTSVWEIQRDDGGTIHPTQKPVQLFEIPMLNHAKTGEVCVEPFCGSGSQLIAGEKLGRRVFAMELDARWVDPVVDRWEQFSGKRAQLVRAKGPKRKPIKAPKADAAQQID